MDGETGGEGADSLPLF